MAIESIGKSAAASFQTISTVKKVTSSDRMENNPDSNSVNADEAGNVQSIPESDGSDSSHFSFEKNAKDQAEADMKAASKDINKRINQNTVAEFGYHEATHRITIKIKDRNTNEVIKEIPSEKALEMLQKAWEIAGILVDEKR